MKKHAKQIRRAKKKAAGVSNRQNGSRLTGSANRVLQILSLFATGPAQASVEEISVAIGVPKSSAYRYVKILKDAGFIVEIGNGQLEVSPLSAGLARNSKLAGKLISTARPVMQRLTQGSRELTLLVKRSGHFGVCVESCESIMPLRYTYEVGATFPLHLPGALRRSLLAYASEDEQERILNEAMHSDPHFKPQRNALRRELETIRQRGYAESQTEITPDLWGIAVPIIVGETSNSALVLLAPAYRINATEKSRLRSAVRGAAREIASQLESMT
jgi:DNA-binding IclR family transcriptional regulator